jgi:hypothetical protein
MFGCKPKLYSALLEKNDHPEMDDAELLKGEDIVWYQSMIGGAQWAIFLRRFDIQTAIMTMSHFMIAPCIGHLEWLQQIHGYLRGNKDVEIIVWVSKPDLTTYPIIKQNWLHLVYGKVEELIPSDVPIPIANDVILTRYADANLYHNMVSIRAVRYAY